MSLVSQRKVPARFAWVGYLLYILFAPICEAECLSPRIDQVASMAPIEPLTELLAIHGEMPIKLDGYSWI